MNGLVNKAPFFAILSAIFALATAIALAASKPPPPASGSAEGVLEAITHLWANFENLKGAAAVGFTAVGAFLWLFSIRLWRIEWLFHPWLVTQRDITGTWFAESMPGAWDPFTTLVHIEHGFFGIFVELIRPKSRGRSVSASLQTVEGQPPRLYVIYDSKVIVADGAPPVSHGIDHTGCLLLDLRGERGPKNDWKLTGEYWTTKERRAGRFDKKAARRIEHKGTWGRLGASWRRRELLALTNPEVEKFLAKYA